MILDTFATKLGMTQAWTKKGQRLAVTRVSLDEMAVVGKQEVSVLDKNSQLKQTLPCTILEVGHGTKKLKNMKKPLRSKLEKGGFSFGYQIIEGVRVVDDKANPATETDYKVGDVIASDSILSVGDVVQVQGVTKGHGFAGAMKRHGFHGGPATHGQSDRSRAVGSIGQRTTPGRVWLGKKMPGHFGDVTKSVSGLVVLHIDTTKKEIWLSGPIPGSIMSEVKISKTGKKKNIELDLTASNLPAVQEKAEEATQESAE
ncbi:MAG: 50S ribosomal protein L3 [Patescibacteria group bacterium]|nr:MAG: 50S ribosomal protein L3 [Patescibacteria group bacterium]